MCKIEFKGGVDALLCDHCNKVITTGDRIPPEAMNGDVDKLLYFCSTGCAIQHKGKLFKTITILEPDDN